VDNPLGDDYFITSVEEFYCDVEKGQLKMSKRQQAPPGAVPFSRVKTPAGMAGHKALSFDGEDGDGEAEEWVVVPDAEKEMRRTRYELMSASHHPPIRSHVPLSLSHDSAPVQRRRTRNCGLIERSVSNSGRPLAASLAGVPSPSPRPLADGAALSSQSPLSSRRADLQAVIVKSEDDLRQEQVRLLLEPESSGSGEVQPCGSLTFVVLRL
jgi:hypothetical protein